jgi:hypothetical protein
MTTAPDRAARDARPASRRGKIIALVAALAAIGIAVAALALATPIMDALHKQHRETFPTYADAQRGWSGVPMPEWIPQDSTDLRNLATTAETNAVIRVDSAAATPVGCTSGQRHGMPSLAADWVPEPANPAGGIWEPTVWRCGPYEVIAADGGFLGWFEATSRGATPETQATP